MKKKKLILSLAFVISLLPMLLHQYGGCRGVQEISGLINLFNPIGLISVLLFFVGVWVPICINHINSILACIGAGGILVSEIYEFFTWHILTVSGKMSFSMSLRFAFPEFYIGLIISALMLVFCICFSRRNKWPRAA